MTYAVGDPEHVTLGHNELAQLVNAELSRFGLAANLNAAHAQGDPDHIGAHNSLLAALQSIATAAGKSYTAALPDTAHLGDHGHTTDHNLMRAAVLEAATWPAWNSATGGTETVIDDYLGTGERWRVHTFTSSGQLQILQASQPFHLLLCGGGGGSGAPVWGNTGGAGGGGAVIWDQAARIPAGSHQVAVGPGGGGGNEHGHHSNSPGGTTSLASYSAGGGGEGGTGHDGNQGRAGGPPNGGHGGDYGPYGGGSSYNNPEIVSSISGTAVTYGVGGYWVDGNGGYKQPNGTGKGGDAHRGGVGDTGGDGIAIVAYRIG